MILIYSHKLTNRLKYIFNTIFTTILNSNVSFTDNIEEFENYNEVKINYSNKKLNTGLFFHCTSLLYENGLKDYEINMFEWENTKCFFNIGKDAAMPFDVFAASFYLVSRYEEYLPHRRDVHDRFIAYESLAYQHNFLNLPLVNIWAKKLKEIIQQQYPNYKFKDTSFQYISTIDVDNAYAIKHKGIVRVLGGLLKSILNPKEFLYKIKVLLSLEIDPFDTFDYQFDLHNKYNIKPIYFFLLGDYAENDKSVSIKNKHFQSLIKSLSDYYQIGIHPSYNSNKDTEILNKEIKRLQLVNHKNVVKSRQHFLKLVLPFTYRNLINYDIEEDYTMGYAEECGFRASICTSYPFYDIDTETVTKLKIVPFAFMDATFQYYKSKNIKEITQEVYQLLNEVKNVNGTFVTIWHNDSLSDKGIWKGWRVVYENILKAI